MKKIISILFLILYPVSALAWVAKVTGVTDGDTLWVFNAGRGKTKVRLYGIDAPESGQPYGREAEQYLDSLVTGATVEIEEAGTDPYGNKVGIILIEERIINQEMVRAGFAWVYRRYCDRPVCEYWVTLEDEARKNKTGLWQEVNPIPPRKWRWMNCD